MKTAIVHDWLNGMRGGEKVLEALIELYPEATIYTLFCERVKISAAIGERRIVTSWLDRVPGIYRHYRNFLPLFPAAVESFDLRDFELVISSSHAVAKSVKAPQALHVCYCHTPMRYLWDAESGYAMRWHQRFALQTIGRRLRQWDRETARRVDHFIANSQFVRGRIRQYYGRESDVIYPPVDTRFYSPSGETPREDFYLAAGAMVSYKRLDVILEAFRKSGRRLLVAGGGAEFHRLQRLAGPNVRFLGWVSDSELRELYRRARAFVFAAREDFGIMPVEARACGCPVIAFAAGGVLETVRDGISGVLFETQQAEAIVQAIVRFEGTSWSNEQVRSGVEEFSRERFKEQIRRFIAEKAEGLIRPTSPTRPTGSSKVAAETASVHRRA
jgi:glycosyltransferase involved in cell wall biosynthesis